jgi:multidrug resistance efflux pump
VTIANDTSHAAAAPPAPPAAPAAGGHFWNPPRHAVRTIAIIAFLAIASVWTILAAWDLPPFDSGIESTDNAYVRGRTAVISPQVSGYVVAVEVHDYQQAEANQELVRIDDRIYRARVAQAEATLAAQIAALANSDQSHASRSAAILGQNAGLANAKAQLLRAEADMARVDNLVRDGSVSVRERDQTGAALAQAQAQLREAEASNEIARQDLRTVDVGRDGLKAQVDAARAQLSLAQIDLEHTVIRAPEAGQLGEIGVRLGQFVTNGTSLFSLVPPDLWVIADFKEAQTAHMAPGEPSTVTVDALDGARFKGHVEYLAPATGSEFAVLKPDNATGNFVKVPQRIGVRIVLDPNQPKAERLRPGMSVEARVDTRHGP